MDIGKEVSYMYYTISRSKITQQNAIFRSHQFQIMQPD